MATNKSVVVLMPNGRRQTVSVSPNTTILQVIEEACKKHGFKPEDYDIKHHRQVLDTNTTLGFSGLPNNAQLELLASTRTRVESDVTIGLQLESGNRLLGTFSPNSTVYDILFKLTPDDLNPAKNTVVIYMRREMYGIEAFKKVDLRSLGLTGGRAIFRVIHKLPEELKTQANISTPILAKPVEEKPYMRKLQKIESPPKQQSPEPIRKEVSEEKKKDEPKTPENVPKKQCIEENAQRTTYKKTNMVDMIKNEKKKQQQVPKKVETAEVKVKTDDKKMEDDFVFLGERNAMLFTYETAQTIRTEDLPDDFFELTIEDAQKLLRDIKKQRIELENNPLMTSKLRNLEESKRQLRILNKYKKTIIRIEFPNRAVLQGTFSITETVKDVIDFVRGFIEDSSLDFYLYTTPPIQILNAESTLLEVNCVPGALLHFGVHNNKNEKEFLRSDLRDKFTTSSTASLAAAKMRQQSKRSDSPLEESNDDLMLMDTTDDVNVGASTSAAQYVDYDKPSTSKEADKVPKWFKATK